MVATRGVRMADAHGTMVAPSARAAESLTSVCAMASNVATTDVATARCSARVATAAWRVRATTMVSAHAEIIAVKALAQAEIIVRALAQAAKIIVAMASDRTAVLRALAVV